MITVDCREVESILNELVVYVADQVGAVPNLKYHEFILSAIEDDDIVEITEAIDQLRMVLNQDINLLCETEEPCAMTLNISNFLNNPPQNMKNILPDYNFQMGTCSQDGQQVQCPEFSWVATSCDSWKESWDVTIGGLFPNMTTGVFFSDLPPEECNGIVDMDF